MSEGKNNTGDMNIGSRNSGNKNIGNYNSGHRNSGDLNSGNGNSGDMNSGDHNSGDMNIGSYNSGNKNIGNCNSGNKNIGNNNSGNWNSGSKNSGNTNIGDWNSGYRNSGAFNSCDNSNGVFCNEEDKSIRIFNRPSGMSWEDFRRSHYWKALHSVEFPLTEWVRYTEEEKQADKKKAAIGGYLKTNTYKEACGKWWAAMDEKNKEIIKSLPNFDPVVFYDITGIDLSDGAETIDLEKPLNLFGNK